MMDRQSERITELELRVRDLEQQVVALREWRRSLLTRLERDIRSVYWRDLWESPGRPLGR